MRTVIIGIGNPLKGDDGVGPYIISKLKTHPDEIGKKLRNLELVDAGTVPENYIQKIINLKPDEIVIVDAIDFGGKPGQVKWLESINSLNISISTHSLPLELFINSITEQAGAKVKIVAIQPRELKFNTSLSEEIKESADKLVQELCIKFM